MSLQRSRIIILRTPLLVEMVIASGLWTSSCFIICVCLPLLCPLISVASSHFCKNSGELELYIISVVLAKFYSSNFFMSTVALLQFQALTNLVMVIQNVQKVFWKRNRIYFKLPDWKCPSSKILKDKSCSSWNFRFTRIHFRIFLTNLWKSGIFLQTHRNRINASKFRFSSSPPTSQTSQSD